MSIFDDNIPTTIDYALISAPIRVDGSLPNTDLTVSRALSKIPDEDRESYRALYRWFEENSGTIGPRLLGTRLPGVGFPHSAQRGIHTPSKRKYAATVTLTKKSSYGDGAFADLGDGTWVLHYCEHRNNTDGSKVSTWNQPLINCLIDGIPVGVFVQEGNSGQSYLRALAFVEEYDPDSGVFVLHGPVSPETEHIFKARTTVHTTQDQTNIPSVEELQKDTRQTVQSTSVVRHGQQRFREELLRAYGASCAVTEYDVGPALQAAHILEYRGTPSNNIKNGIVLRADIHILFDRALLAFDPSNYKVVLAKGIANSHYAELDGKNLRLPKNTSLWPSEDYVAASFARFQQIQSIAGKSSQSKRK